MVISQEARRLSRPNPFHMSTHSPSPLPRRAFLVQIAAMAARPLVIPHPGRASPPPIPTRAPQEASDVDLGVLALNRMAFGPRPGDLDAFRALGPTPQARLEALVEQQLHPEAIDDTALETRLQGLSYETLQKSLKQLWADHMLSEDDDVHYRPAWEASAATWQRILYSRRQLLEVMVSFWHNHFSVFLWQWEVAPVFVHYDRDVIRTHALGNFRQMLEAVATSTAMLYYLDNFNNSRAGPNENYARELLELHTLGAEHYLGVRDQRTVPGFDEGMPVGYVDEDVYEATRCFTGWRVNDSDDEPGVQNTGTFLYYDEWHDRFQKTFLGHHIPSDQAPMKDGRDVLDLLAAHPGVGEFIARKLCRLFVADDPPADLVAQAAAVFTAQRHAPDQIRQVLRVILLSDAFQQSWGQKFKRPLEFTASALRALNAEMEDMSEAFYWMYWQMGQPLFSRTTPDGYPDVKEDWLTTQGMLQRWRFAGAVLNNWLDGLTVDLQSQTPADLRTPIALVDFWSQRLLGRAMPQAQRQVVVDFMAQGRNPTFPLPRDDLAERLPSMVQLILMAPSFQYR